MMEELSVSVIIPTYNRPESLVEAVRSVLDQSIPPQEIVVVNDGEYFDEGLLNSSDSLKVIHNERSMGANYCRNLGVDETAGEIVMFLDDDDTWEPTKIADQLRLFQDPEIGLVYTGKLVVDEKDRGKVLYSIPAAEHGMINKEIFYRNLIGSTSGVALRRVDFYSAGKFDEVLGALQDYDLWIRIAQFKKVAADGGFNLRYTVTSGSDRVSVNIEKRLKAITHLQEKYRENIADLTRTDRLKVKSFYQFLRAQVLRTNGRMEFLYWLALSFITFPQLRILGLLLPENVLNLTRKTVGR